MIFRNDSLDSMHGQSTNELPCHYAYSSDSIQLSFWLKSGKIAIRPSCVTKHFLNASLHHMDDQN